MLSHNISSVIFSVGYFQISWYVLVYVLGFVLALLLLLRASKKEQIKISEGQIYDVIILGIVSLLIGARIFHVLFWGFNYYFSDPIRILYIWRGGFSFHGGLIGVFVTIGLYCKWKGINFWKIADLFAFLGILMPVFSRFANFVNQEIVGTITNLPWCFNFKFHDGCRHPVQLYASFGRLVFFFGMLGLNRIKKFKDGFLFWLFVLGIGIGRFILDFIREDLRYAGLSAGQWLSLVMILIGGYFLLKSYRVDLKNLISS